LAVLFHFYPHIVDFLFSLYYNLIMEKHIENQEYLIDFQFIREPKPLGGVRLYQIGKKFCSGASVVLPHLHVDWYELTVVIGGKGRIYTNSKTDFVEVSEGDIYLSFPADIHTIESDSEFPLQYSFLSFILDEESQKETFAKLSQDFYEADKRVFREQNVSFLLDMLLSEFLMPAYRQEEMQANTLNQILIFTSRNFLHQPKQAVPANISKNEALCYAIMRYIDANIFSIKNFSAIAEHFNYNYSYLSKVFKQTTKITLLDYLSNKKLERAKILIEEGELSLTKIAELLNYASVYSFSKSFKYHFGSSPTEYKKNAVLGRRSNAWLPAR